MLWKCLRCGFETNADDSRHCDGGCGFVRIPRSISLISSATGKQIKMAVETKVGKYLLRSIAGEESAFASEPQFKVYKDETLGAWVIQHLDGAKNPTFCDGASITAAPAPLQEGCVVSIGPERMKLAVHFED